MERAQVVGCGVAGVRAEALQGVQAGGGVVEGGVQGEEDLEDPGVVVVGGSVGGGAGVGRDGHGAAGGCL